MAIRIIVIFLFKVTLQLKTWLQKRGVKTQCDIVEVWDTVGKILKDRNADANGTPGRGLFGKAVVNMLTGEVSLLFILMLSSDRNADLAYNAMLKYPLDVRVWSSYRPKAFLHIL